MNDCPRCGGRERVFFERAPVRLAMSIAALTLVIVVLRSNPWPPMTVLALKFVGGGLALSPILSALRIRCFECEPEWQAKVWGGSGTRTSDSSE